MQIVDVSHHNVVSNFDSADIDGIMIRASYGKNRDTKFLEHLRLAKMSGKPYGFYFYSYATTMDGLIAETGYFITLIKANTLPQEVLLPLCIDMEDADGYKAERKWTPKLAESFCRKACDMIIDAGYPAMVYCSDSFTSNWDDFAGFAKAYLWWGARWGENAPASAEYDLWQYTSRARVSGIDGYVDMSRTDKPLADMVLDFYKCLDDELKPLTDIVVGKSVFVEMQGNVVRAVIAGYAYGMVLVELPDGSTQYYPPGKIYE